MNGSYGRFDRSSLKIILIRITDPNCFIGISEGRVHGDA